jgi:hypothetical protein
MFGPCGRSISGGSRHDIALSRIGDQTPNDCGGRVRAQWACLRTAGNDTTKSRGSCKWKSAAAAFDGGRGQRWCPVGILKPLCRGQPDALIVVNRKAAADLGTAVAVDMASRDAANNRRYPTRRSGWRTTDFPRPLTRGGREPHVGRRTGLFRRAPSRSSDAVASPRSRAVDKDHKKSAGWAVHGRDDADPRRVRGCHSQGRQGDGLYRGSLRPDGGQRDGVGAPRPSG